MLHSICQKIWKIHLWPQVWKKSILIPIPKKNSIEECSNHWANAQFFHACFIYSFLVSISWTSFFNYFIISLGLYIILEVISSYSCVCYLVFSKARYQPSKWWNSYFLSGKNECFKWKKVYPELKLLFPQIKDNRVKPFPIQILLWLSFLALRNEYLRVILHD